MARVNSIDHVQLAMPPGAEDLVREFYAGVLGLTEVSKPPELAKRGGAWFEGPSIKLHLGVEQEFRPARKAHVGFIVDNVAELVDICRSENLENHRRQLSRRLPPSPCIRSPRQPPRVHGAHVIY